MIFPVTVYSEEDGWIVVERPALPGRVSQGRDEKDALSNIEEAIPAWLWAEDQGSGKHPGGLSAGHGSSLVGTLANISGNKA